MGPPRQYWSYVYDQGVIGKLTTESTVEDTGFWAYCGQPLRLIKSEQNEHLDRRRMTAQPAIGYHQKLWRQPLGYLQKKNFSPSSGKSALGICTWIGEIWPKVWSWHLSNSDATLLVGRIGQIYLRYLRVYLYHTSATETWGDGEMGMGSWMGRHEPFSTT